MHATVCYIASAVKTQEPAHAHAELISYTVAFVLREGKALPNSASNVIAPVSMALLRRVDSR